MRHDFSREGCTIVDQLVAIRIRIPLHSGIPRGDACVSANLDPRWINQPRRWHRKRG